MEPENFLRNMVIIVACWLGFVALSVSTVIYIAGRYFGVW